MRTFRTDVSIITSSDLITLKNRVLTAGSCFADAIGKRLYRYKFSTLVNPFGTIYNPVSIHQTLNYGLENSALPPNSFVEKDGVFLNYNLHSTLSATDRKRLDSHISETVNNTHQFLQNTAYIFITYGTAWVYERIDTGEIVANCHKMSQKLFRKRLLSESEIVNSFTALYNTAKMFIPGVKFILTVSPVRHLKDTLELNSVSKAVLRTTCHNIVAEKKAEYFPAYEIMMDDLRDYRFYKSDMLHPTEEAEDYIWEKFGDRYFDSNTRSFLKKWDSILTAINHKPFHPASAAHQQFLAETLQRLSDLPGIDISQEQALIEAQIMPDKSNRK
jgi:hypothetical protein